MKKRIFLSLFLLFTVNQTFTGFTTWTLRRGLPLAGLLNTGVSFYKGNYRFGLLNLLGSIISNCLGNYLQQKEDILNCLLDNTQEDRKEKIPYKKFSALISYKDNFNHSFGREFSDACNKIEQQFKKFIDNFINLLFSNNREDQFKALDLYNNLMQKTIFSLESKFCMDLCMQSMLKSQDTRIKDLMTDIMTKHNNPAKSVHFCIITQLGKLIHDSTQKLVVQTAD